MQALRYWDYYGMTGLFSDLYDRAAKQETFSNLYDVITDNRISRYSMKMGKNSVLGIHNYFRWATHVNIEFARLAYDLRAFMYNRLKQIGKYEHPANPPPTYSKFYSRGFRTFRVATVYLYPLADVKTRNTMNFSQNLTLYTAEGRERIHHQLIHYTHKETIDVLITKLGITESMVNMINQYRYKCGLEPIEQSQIHE